MTYLLLCWSFYDLGDLVESQTKTCLLSERQVAPYTSFLAATNPYLQRFSSREAIGVSRFQIHMEPAWYNSARYARFPWTDSTRDSFRAVSILFEFFRSRVDLFLLDLWPRTTMRVSRYDQFNLTFLIPNLRQLEWQCSRLVTCFPAQRR